MRLPLLFLAIAPLLCTAQAKRHATKTVPFNADCPPVHNYDAEYHLDSACDKRAQNKFQDSLNKGRQRNEIQEAGIYHVPDKLTRTCPHQVWDLFQHFDSHSSDKIYNYGYSTVWLVHNKGETPVVVSWLDRTKRHKSKESGHSYYHEVSAFDGRTSPPHKDPRAILKPGEWRAMNTFDGHVFHVRQLLSDGTLGPVVLQHRVGLIPITNVFGHALEQYCDPNDPDVEPVVEVDGHEERAPEFRRSLRPPLRPCNTQDIGFRNLVGCPLHVYYSGMFNMTGNPRQAGEDCSFTPKSCHEQFKFHLGKNPYSNDFHWAWDSQTKFEGTYVGHNFVFRLQANDEIVVDSVTVLPTNVQDCSPKDLLDRQSETDGFLLSLGDQQRERQQNNKSPPGDAPSARQQLRGVPGFNFDDEEF